MSRDGRVTRADIEAKLAEIRDEVEREAEQAKGMALGATVLLLVVVVAVAYLLGRRRGRRRRALVEIRRV